MLCKWIVMETGTALNLNVILPLLFLWLSDIVSVSLRSLTGTKPAISTNKRPKLNQSRHLKRRFNRHLTKNQRYRHRRSDRDFSQRPNLRSSRSVTLSLLCGEERQFRDGGKWSMHHRRLKRSSIRKIACKHLEQGNSSRKRQTTQVRRKIYHGL